MRALILIVVLVLGGCVAAPAIPQPASPQDYPARPVKIIVAFPPGGGNDFIARFIAARLSASLGQQFIVENRPGAGGTVGFEAGLKALPDGYTLTLISNSYTANASIFPLAWTLRSRRSVKSTSRTCNQPIAQSQAGRRRKRQWQK